MKDPFDSTAAERALEPEEYSNRRLIRPSLSRSEHSRIQPTMDSSLERRDRGDRGGKKTAPPEQTNAENFYYQKQMQSKTPMVVVLKDGEEIHGIIEWYDRNCIKVNRNGQPNLMIYKPCIKYMFKESEDGRRNNG
jgi:host factor-I protein